MRATVLIMPGINNSGPTHWQSLWEEANPVFRRIQVDDWDRPECASWIASIDRAVTSVEQPVILVAHSLGCLPVIEWAMRGRTDRVRGALLVSVPDPLGPNFPAEATGFTPLPLQRLPFKSIVVSSENDPYGGSAYARRCADEWGSRFVNIGAAGHINAASNLGAWDEGMALLRSLPFDIAQVTLKSASYVES